MLAVGTFERYDGFVTSYANASAYVSDDGAAGGSTFTQFSDVLTKSDAHAQVGNGGGFAFGFVDGIGFIPIPIGASVPAPFVNAKCGILYTVNGYAGALLGPDYSSFGNAIGHFAYNEDPEFTGDLVMHVHLYLVATGGAVVAGNAENFTMLRVSAGINGPYGIDAETGDGSTWTVSTFLPGMQDAQVVNSSGINLHVTFTIPVSGISLFSSVGPAVDGGAGGDSIDGSVEGVFGLTTAAWAYVTEEGHDSTPGDFNSDGNVDSNDYNLWKNGDPRADADLDADVDNDDFDIWAANATGVVIVSDPTDEINSSDGILSLREALSTAGSNTIVFDPSITSITLTYDGSDLGSTPDELTANGANILGPGADKLTISGGEVTRVLSGSNSTIDGVTITAGSTTGEGGGIYGSNWTIRESRITGNTAYHGGGLFAVGSLQLINSEVSENTARDGAGIYITTTTPGYAVEIRNSTISGNTAASNGYGGGIFSYIRDYESGSTFKITNSTITDNTAFYGGGLYTHLYNGSWESGFQPTITNTIIAGNRNHSNNPDDVWGYTDFANSSHNLIGYDPNGFFASGTGNIRGTSSAIDPHLGELAFNGARTRTHALLFNSDAIDAGDNDFVDNDDGLAADQRGLPNTRIVDWDDNLTATVDIGAFELAIGEYYG